MTVVASAIIVSYNSARTLAAALAALRDPGGRVEAIVVDNASHDGSVAAARAAGARIIASGRNVGYARACNLGSEAAVGEVLVFANPDTAVPAATALKAVEILVGDPQLGILGLPRVSEGRYVSRAKRAPTLAWLVREVVGIEARPIDPPRGAALVEADWVPGSAFAIRRDLYREVGGMDAAIFLYFEDVDLGDRVRAHGRRVAELTDPAFAIAHAESGHANYHSRMKLYAWHRACAQYFEKRGHAPVVVRTLLAARALVRIAFWSLKRIFGHVSGAAYRQRLCGYIDVLRFWIGNPPPLPTDEPRGPA